MKIFGRLVALLGLSFAVFASPGDERFSFARSPQTRNPAPPSRRVVTSTGLSPLSTLVGGDTCSSPTPISTLPFNDTGTTTGMADNSVNELRFACGIVGSGPDRPGPDVFYSFTIVGFGNSLTFSLTTTSPQYDPAIYVLSVCGDLDSCAGGADVNFEGEPETLTVSGLAPGTYYLGVDSAFSPADPTFASGNYALNVTGTFGNPSAVAGFYTLAPCRVADTRGAAGPYGGPALQAGISRTFAMAGRCQIPPEADALAMNVTVTEPTAPGHIIVYPLGVPLPLASTINFSAGKTRANNAIIPLGTNDSIAAVSGQSSGTTHFIIDVVGYFRFVGP